MYKIIVYGLGNRFNLFEKFVYRFIKNKIIIVGVSDSNMKDTGFRFVKKDKLCEEEFDYIIITSDKYYEEIRNELITLYHIDSTKLISMDEITNSIYNKIFCANLFKGKKGVEVGGPSKIFESIYKACAKCDGVNFSSETVWWKKDGIQYNYNNRNLGEMIIADATDLSIVEDDAYDFYISSNNLEHIANPMLAIEEAIRVIKKEGILLIVVPRKDSNFDHKRKDTTFAHLLEDYNCKVNENDLSHLPEILEMHDVSMDVGVQSIEEFEERSMKNLDNRCLHHHVFNESLLIDIFNYWGLQILSSGNTYDNYYIIGKK